MWADVTIETMERKITKVWNEELKKKKMMRKWISTTHTSTDLPRGKHYL